MVNTNNPFGFRQFGRREGGAPTAGLERLFGLSSDPAPYFTGDLVRMSTVAGRQGYIGTASSIATVGSTNPIVGVFLGCEYFSPNVGRVIWDKFFPGAVGSSSPWNAYVCTDPEQLYIVQATSAAVLGTSCIGYGIQYNYALTSSDTNVGNTVTGISALTVYSSFITGLSTAADFKIVDVYSNVAPPGVNGTSTTAEGLQIVVVQPNNFTRGARTTATST